MNIDLSADDVMLLVWLRQSMKDGTARSIREAARLSLAEATSPADIEISTLHRWEKGLHRPRGPAALSYARFLRELQRRAAA